MIAIAVGVAVSIFVKNPILVGCKKYFTINSFDIPKMGEVVFAFKKGIYLNVVKVEFFKNLFIFLWSLLFVIPGIIKGYEYYMVDYILSEDPTIDYKDALEQSKNMMMGYKWSTFVLELSFLGWGILSALTCGILGFFYVNPYIYATNAELFLYLREKRFPNAAPYYTPSFAGGYAGAAPGANQFNQGVPSQQAAQNQGQYNPGFGGQDFNSGFGGQDYNPGFSAPAQPYDPRNNAPQNGTQEPSQNKYSMNQDTPQDDQPSEPPVDPDGYYNP